MEAADFPFGITTCPPWSQINEVFHMKTIGMAITLNSKSLIDANGKLIAPSRLPSKSKIWELILKYALLRVEVVFHKWFSFKNVTYFMTSAFLGIIKIRLFLGNIVPDWLNTTSIVGWRCVTRCGVNNGEFIWCSPMVTSNLRHLKRLLRCYLQTKLIWCSSMLNKWIWHLTFLYLDLFNFCYVPPNFAINFDMNRSIIIVFSNLSISLFSKIHTFKFWSIFDFFAVIKKNRCLCSTTRPLGKNPRYRTFFDWGRRAWHLRLGLGIAHARVKLEIRRLRNIP